MTHVYTATGTLEAGQADTNNVYFGDLGTSSELLLQARVSGGAPTTLYTAPAPTGTRNTLLGSNGSLLIFSVSTSGGSSPSTTIETVPTSGASTTAATIATFPGTGVATPLWAPPSGDPTKALLFVTVVATTGGNFSYSTEVLAPTGTVVQPSTANS